MSRGCDYPRVSQILLCKTTVNKGMLTMPRLQAFDGVFTLLLHNVTFLYLLLQSRLLLSVVSSQSSLPIRFPCRQITILFHCR